MRPRLDSPHPGLRLLGLVVFALGLAWDVVYHTLLLLIPSGWPASFDAVGDLGHIITLAGISIVVFTFLRIHPDRP